MVVVKVESGYQESQDEAGTVPRETHVEAQPKLRLRGARHHLELNWNDHGSPYAGTSYR